jgi:hypothetical protein
MALSKQATKNKVAKPGASFDSKLVAAKPPHQPRISPQTDHKITTPKTILFPKHPSKMPTKPQNLTPNSIQKKTRKNVT